MIKKITSNIVIPEILKSIETIFSVLQSIIGVIILSINGLIISDMVVLEITNQYKISIITAIIIAQIIFFLVGLNLSGIKLKFIQSNLIGRISNSNK